jgi:hypothetical protein
VLSQPPAQDSVEPLEKLLYPEIFTIFLRNLLRIDKMKGVIRGASDREAVDRRGADLPENLFFESVPQSSNPS